jgi:TFIIF-interacting CTD phosphatase-like protein
MLARTPDKYATPPERRHSKGSSSGSKRNLHVDTNDAASSPRTEASTPSPANGVRNSGDLRSPGQRKSPLAKIDADKIGPVPDFMTQTDQYGNASTPRSEAAVQRARTQHPSAPMPNLHVGKDGKLNEQKDDELDACTETLMDSFRIMCCCLVSDDETPTENESPVKEDKQEQVLEDDRPRLLPAIHPDDTGKKCLVLDLDETLVHSSFRAVPGADFVIPVQVRDL